MDSMHGFVWAMKARTRGRKCCHLCGAVDSTDQSTLNLWGHWMRPRPLYALYHYTMECRACGNNVLLKASDLTKAERVWVALLEGAE